MQAPKLIIFSALAAILLRGGPVAAQSFRKGGTEFNAQRPVSILAGKSYTIVVTEFYHHGEINLDGRNVAVAIPRKGLVPWRVLQLGPGDFCRLAFQPADGESSYEILYGGEPPTEAPPPWTAHDGLLLETRQYKHCDLRSLDSVREAFDSSRPIGGDYVENVHHARNPFSLKPGPFLSRYSGYLQIPSAGTYGFLTSSRDSSFLLIDGKEVVSALKPLYRATRGTRKDVRLSPGPHKFEYYHAAAGTSAMMVAAWEVSPPEEKPKPAAIPSESFRTGRVGHLPAGHVSLKTGRPVPDFVFTIDGDVPLPDNDVALIGVLFRDRSPKNLTLSAKAGWNFGDGQTSDKLDVDHVYLRPGLYPVKLSVKRGSRTIEITHRIQIDRPPLTRKDQEKFHKLDDYLPILKTYNPRTLDAVALRQLVLAYEAKAMAVQVQAEEEKKKAEAEQEDENRRPTGRRKPAAVQPPPAWREYISAAVEAGKVAFLGQSAARGADDLAKLAQLVGPMARDRLGESRVAFDVWQGAAQRIDVGGLKARCQVEAADVAVNDLLDAAAAKRLLDAAAGQLAGVSLGPDARQFHRVRGDYYALTGNGQAARKAYQQADQIPGSGRRYIERTAWRGAHSRSTEQFIKQQQYDRAVAEIRAWQGEFPTEKIDGYLTLMYGRYWAGRQKYDQAIAQAEQLQAVNADSPYIDQVLLLAAECEMKRGRADRALATLHGLVKDYPGSPLIPDVKKIIARLEARSSDAASQKQL